MRKRADIVLVERGLFPSRTRAQAAIAAGLRQSGRRCGQQGVRGGRRGRFDHRAAASPMGLARRREARRGARRFCPRSGGLVCSRCRRLDRRLHRRSRHAGRKSGRRNRCRPRAIRSPPRGGSAREPSSKVSTRATSRAEIIGEAPQAIVCDVSFISQGLVLPHVLSLAAPSAWLVSLIKPQFEAGPADIVKGRVRSEAALARACEDVRACVAAEGWTVLGIMASPILGGGGAKEYLIAAMK